MNIRLLGFYSAFLVSGFETLSDMVSRIWTQWPRWVFCLSFSRSWVPSFPHTYSLCKGFFLVVIAVTLFWLFFLFVLIISFDCADVVGEFCPMHISAILFIDYDWLTGKKKEFKLNKSILVKATQISWLYIKCILVELFSSMCKRWATFISFVDLGVVVFFIFLEITVFLYFTSQWIDLLHKNSVIHLWCINVTFFLSDNTSFLLF